MSGRYRGEEYYTTRGREDRVEVASHHSRSRAGSPSSRTPAFLLRDDRSSAIGGQMVLRHREVETGIRHRSPSPVSVRSERRILRQRSTSPLSDRMVIRERSRSRGPAERVVIRGRSRSRDSTDRIVIRERSRSRASADRVVIRDRSRSRGPAERIRLVERERSPVERVRVVKHSRSRSRRRSPSPDTYRARVLERERGVEFERDRESRRARSPEREVIQGPVIEREVITHWRDIDHGVVRVPSPPKPRRSTLETDIDINITHSRSRSRARSRSRSRVRRLSHERLPPVHYHDDTEIVIRSDRERLRIDDRDDRHRSHSAAPLRSPSPSYSEEADYITSRIDSRGRVGEAYHGATRDWTIVDVPPGTERVRMDGKGGGSAEVTWQRYNGVRRSKFIPGGEERDTYVREDRSSRDSKELVIVDSPTYDRGGDREIEIEMSRRKTRTSTDMWTEITKDLVCKEALEEAGYDYEETEWFFYVMQYLRYEDVLELVNRSDRIRRSRRSRRRSTHEIEYDRDYRDYRDYHDHHHDHHDHHYHRDSSHSHRFHVGGGTKRHHYDLDLEYEREKERDVILDRRY